MARKVKKSANKKSTSEVQTIRIGKQEHRQLGELKGVEYNPRTMNDQQLDATCRSIVEFGFVDPIAVRAETGEILGGHQRVKAVHRLLAGQFKVKGKAIKFALPPEGLPVTAVYGLSDTQAKKLNLALNRIGGDWDNEKLARMIDEIANDNQSVDDMLSTGFTPAEITDYRDLLAEDPTTAGSKPEASKKAPSISLDFSTPELRDAVKAAIAAASKTNKAHAPPSGDVLASMLSINVKKRKAFARAS